MVGMSGHSYHCTDAAPDKVQHGTDELGEAGPQRCRSSLSFRFWSQDSTTGCQPSSESET